MRKNRSVNAFEVNKGFFAKGLGRRYPEKKANVGQMPTIDGKVKSSSSRRREFRRMRRNYVCRSEHEMRRNAEIRLFTKQSNMLQNKTNPFVNRHQRDKNNLIAQHPVTFL